MYLDAKSTNYKGMWRRVSKLRIKQIRVKQFQRKKTFSKKDELFCIEVYK
jgi:hypothetical protein